MIIAQIKDRIKEAMKQKLSAERDILRLIVGLAQQADDYSDDSIIKIITKIVKSNNETIEAMKGSDKYEDSSAELVEQSRIISSYLPQSFSEQEILSIIESNNIFLENCAGDGQAIGMVVKALKADGSKSIDNSIVRKVVLEKRAS